MYGCLQGISTPLHNDPYSNSELLPRIQCLRHCFPVMLSLPVSPRCDKYCTSACAATDLFSWLLVPGLLTSCSAVSLILAARSDCQTCSAWAEPPVCTVYCQVWGQKQIWLIDPGQTDSVRPFKTPLVLRNTSTTDVSDLTSSGGVTAWQCNLQVCSVMTAYGSWGAVTVQGL